MSFTLESTMPVTENSSIRPAAWEDESTIAFNATLAGILLGDVPVRLHYQPIVDLKRGVVVGYEALSRFPSSMGPSPDITFAAAALVGKNHLLEEQVVRTAFAGKASLPPNTFLTVNVSPGFLLSPHWDAALASVDSLSGFVIEITEEESIRDYEPVRYKLDHIRDLGGLIAVDDAGSGYASLSHVIEIRPSFIKLDRALIRDCHAERAKSVLIEMMGRAANRLDAWIIAEGVETTQELNELIDLGVPLGQGYHLGRPGAVMEELSVAKAAAIRTRVFDLTGPDKLLPHVQLCPIRHTKEEAVESLSSSTTRATVAVVVDRWRRPIQMLHCHPLVGVHCLSDFIKIQRNGDPAEVLQRALTRPPLTRFDPIAVIDGQGTFQGIVRIEVLMSAFLRERNSVN